MKRVVIPFRHPHKLAPYEAAVRAAGMDSAPAAVSDACSLRDAAGLLLMGGTDVNPSRYRERAQPETDTPDDERDAIELDLIHQAIESDLPILAICRGLQILNVYHGGTLIQHLASAARHDVETENKAAPAHDVSIEPDTLLRSIAGQPRWEVNSRHHQAVGKPGESLIITARDTEDGTIEGLERPDRTFVLAVQWHPEDQVFEHPAQLRLFQRFAQACR